MALIRERVIVFFAFNHLGVSAHNHIQSYFLLICRNQTKKPIENVTYNGAVTFLILAHNVSKVSKNLACTCISIIIFMIKHRPLR